MDYIVLRFDSPKFRIGNLIGFLWLTLAIFNYLYEGFDWSTGLYLVLAVFHLGFLFFDKNDVYVEIDGKQVVVHGVLRRKIRIENIERVTVEETKISIHGGRTPLIIDKHRIHRDDTAKLVYFDQFQTG